MAFWRENDVKPKRNFRFQITFNGDILWYAKSVVTPSWSVAEVVHHHFDNQYYYPGRVTWEDVSMTLVDPISEDALLNTNSMLSKLGYSVKGASDTNPTIRKAGAMIPGAVAIKVLDESGNVVEEWTMKNVFVKSMKLGDLSYESDDLRTIDLTLRYDWAVCTHADGTELFGT